MGLYDYNTIYNTIMIKTVEPKDKKQFDRLAVHPLQSWEWGEFRLKTGIDVLRLGRYEKNELVETAQITFHPIPFTSLTIGFLPKGKIPSLLMLENLKEAGRRKNTIHIK